MLRRVMLAAALLAAASALADDPPPAQETPVRATLEVLTPTVSKPSELRVAVEVTNPSDAPVDVNTTFFRLTSVVLEVTDAAGKPVPKLPPPLPPSDPNAGTRPFAAGESLQLEFRGSELFGLPMAPGEYRIRFRVPPLESGWGTFTVQ